MSYYFDINELKHSMNDSKKYSHRFERTYTVKLGKLKELCGRLPEENEAFFIETKKSFTAFTFIVYLIQHTGYINSLYIATYSTNERIINALIRWKEAGKIGAIHLHISDTLKFRMPKVYQRLLQLQQNGILDITLAWTHKKITCMDTPAGEFIVEGSGNYGENAMQEQYIFLKSKQVYDFRIGNS